MILSHDKRFVILAPWKTASSTMRARLGAYCQSPYPVFYDYNPVLQRVVHQHMTYADFSALPESRLGYTSAAFVRNPYNRVYSGFRQMLKDVQVQPFQKYSEPWVKSLVMGQLSENFSMLCKAQFEFNAWLEQVEEHHIYQVGRNTSFPMHPAYYWTHWQVKQTVDIIGRVESFEADFDMLCGKLGIENAARVNANVDSPPTQALGEYKYIKQMTPASIAKINHLFRHDFELFGYRMQAV